MKKEIQMAAQRQKIKKIVQVYKKVLEKLGLHIEKIILYGSYACFGIERWRVRSGSRGSFPRHS